MPERDDGMQSIVFSREASLVHLYIYQFLLRERLKVTSINLLVEIP